MVEVVPDADSAALHSSFLGGCERKTEAVYQPGEQAAAVRLWKRRGGEDDRVRDVRGEGCER